MAIAGAFSDTTDPETIPAPKMTEEPVTKVRKKKSKTKSASPKKASHRAKGARSSKPRKPKSTAKKLSSRKTHKTAKVRTSQPSLLTGEGIATKTRSGKAIHRSRAGESGVLASKGVYALVVRVPRELHAALWKSKGESSMQSFLISALEKAAK
jgi:hypothetical protein